MSKNIIILREDIESAVKTVIADKNFWPGNVPPVSIEQLINWLLKDVVDYYKSSKEGQ